MLLIIILQMLGLVLIGGWISHLMAVKKRSPHALWPLVLSAIYAIGQTYGFPLALVYWRSPVIWSVLSWSIVAYLLATTTFAMLYAWDCSIAGAVPTIAGYRRFVIAHTAALLKRTRFIGNR